MNRRAASALRDMAASLDRSQWRDPADVRADQRRALVALAEQHSRTTPFFRGRMQAAELTPDDLGRDGGLQALPPLTRRDVQSAGDGLFAVDADAHHRPPSTAISSGSTGEPVKVRTAPMNSLLTSAITLRDHAWHDLHHRGRLASVRANISTRQAPSWGRPASLVGPTGPAQGIAASMPIAEMASILEHFEPTLMIAYPSVVDALATHWADRSTVPTTLRTIQTTGETLDPATRWSALTVFGARIWDGYSCMEVGTIASECPSGSGLYHVMAETVLVEVDVPTGEPFGPGVGKVLVTDLHNPHTPLFRYETGDLATITDPCPCRRGLPTIGRIRGRSRNLVALPDGTRRFPLVGFYKFRDIAPIRQYQVTQRSLDRVDVTLVADRPLTADETDELSEVVATALGHPFEIRVVEHNDPLARGRGGKFEDFVCEVP